MTTIPQVSVGHFLVRRVRYPYWEYPLPAAIAEGATDFPAPKLKTVESVEAVWNWPVAGRYPTNEEMLDAISYGESELGRRVDTMIVNPQPGTKMWGVEIR